MDNQFEENPYFSNKFLPLSWTKFHIEDQLKHSISEPYTAWSSMYKDLDTVTNPPTTQGVIELTALFNNLMLRKFYCTVSTVLWYDLNFVLIFTGFFPCLLHSDFICR